MVQTKSKRRRERVSVLWWNQLEILPHAGEKPTWDLFPGPGGLCAWQPSDLLLWLGERCALALSKNTNAMGGLRGLIHLKHDAHSNHASPGIPGVAITARMPCVLLHHHMAV